MKRATALLNSPSKTVPPAGDRPAPGAGETLPGAGPWVVASAPIPSTVDPGKAERDAWSLLMSSRVNASCLLALSA